MLNFFSGRRADLHTQQQDITHALNVQRDEQRKLVGEIEASAGHLRSFDAVVADRMVEFQVAANRSRGGRKQ